MAENGSSSVLRRCLIDVQIAPERTSAPHHGMPHECQNRTHAVDAKPFCQRLRFTASYASRLNSTANGCAKPISRCAMIKPAVFFFGEIHHCVPARPPQESSPLAS